jgi:hypothetical protein
MNWKGCGSIRLLHKLCIISECDVENEETFEKTRSARAKFWTQNLPNNAIHATANFYCSFGKMEILKQKNTSVDVSNTRKLDGLQQARHSHTASRIYQPRPIPSICTFQSPVHNEHSALKRICVLCYCYRAFLYSTYHARFTLLPAVGELLRILHNLRVRYLKSTLCWINLNLATYHLTGLCFTIALGQNALVFTRLKVAWGLM